MESFHPVLFLYFTKWFLFLREPGTYHSIEIHSRSANPIIVFIVIDEKSDRFMLISKDTSTGIANSAVAAVPSCIIHRATPLHQQANHHLVRSSANQLYLFLYFLYLFISKILFILLIREGGRYQIRWIFEKVPKRGRWSFSIQKIMLQILGTLNRTFWAWNWYKRVTSGFRVCFFLQQLYWEKSKQDTLWRRHFWIHPPLELFRKLIPFGGAPP